MKAKQWVDECTRDGLQMCEKEFVVRTRAEYPQASYQLPNTNDFHKFVGSWANLNAQGAEHARSRSPRR